MTDALTHDLEHSARGVARLIDRYRKTRNSALLASWLDEVQQVEDALWQLLVERSLATAEGDQLDVLGEIVGQPREGRDDETYRLWISARLMVLRSSGTTREMLQIARTLVGETDTVRLEEYFPAAFVMRLGGGLTLTLGYQIAYMLRQAKAAGVLLEVTWPTSATPFRFAPADEPVPDSPNGFDEGEWSIAGDGSYNPPVESESEVPEGALVIGGVPLTIGGAYLVITPTLMAAAAPARTPAPLVARGVHVVPRAAPLAAPMPLSVTTIELVDAFSDASLEMDEEGDQFRVAMALQGVIEDTQAAVIEVAADIAALEAADVALGGAIDAVESDIDAIETSLVNLETEVGAVRFPFTLRTTTVDSTSYEEIGVQRFDATGLGTGWFLVAELEVAAGGQTVDLQLYDLTAAAVVTTLTSTSTTTDKQTAAITLPLAEHLYSVRLRRTGGDASQRVSCRSVAFER